MFSKSTSIIYMLESVLILYGQNNLRKSCLKMRENALVRRIVFLKKSLKIIQRLVVIYRFTKIIQIFNRKNECYRLKRNKVLTKEEVEHFEQFLFRRG